MNNLLVLFTLLFVCVGGVSSTMCYFCGNNCPNPFYPSSSVLRQYSGSGYCAKKSFYADYRLPASRGPAEYGLCYYSGCRWQTLGGVQTYVCCCRSDYCNTGSMTSKSTIIVLLGALALVVVNRYI